jgi:hypothetical protein
MISIHYLKQGSAATVTEKKRRRLRHPVAVSESLDDFMEDVMPERGRLRKILRTWRETVGEDVFLNARPAAIRRGILFVTVSDPIWQSELRYFNTSLIEKINSVLGEDERIHDIRYRLGYLEGVRPEEDARKEAEQKTEAAVGDLPAGLRESVLGVKDESLRSILARIASTIKDKR